MVTFYSITYAYGISSNQTHDGLSATSTLWEDGDRTSGAGRVVQIRDEMNIFALTQKLDKCHSFPTGAAGRYFISYVIVTKKATQTNSATGTPGNVDLMTVCMKVQSRVYMWLIICIYSQTPSTSPRTPLLPLVLCLTSNSPLWSPPLWAL